MTIHRGLASAAAVIMLAVACGSSDDNNTQSTTSTSTAEATTTIAENTTTSVESTSSTTESTTSSDSTTTSSTTDVPVLEQPAIWPAPDVVFDSPEDAAADFVFQILGVPPALGEFRQGDGRSGEIEVLSVGEGGGTPIVRGLLFLRQLGPHNGWFVLAAADESNTIETPPSMDQVPAGQVEVTGRARGFEATVIVEAFVAGDASRVDQQVTQGGSAETPKPYAVTLDLSGVESGETVLLLVKGGVGLETDPGEFSAIPVTIE